jgi:glucokinase
MAAREARPVIGIDLGGTNITGGLVGADQKVVGREKLDTKAELGPDTVVERIGQCIKALCKARGLAPADLAGVGLGVPGAVDAERGLVLEAVNLRWNDMPVAKRLGDLVGTPVTVDNDVNVGAWGEFRLGAAKGRKGVLAVFVGTGIGGGLILNGKLFTGPFGTAGEIGHTVIDSRAPFGMRTLEQIASRTAIVNRLVALISANHDSIIVDLAGAKWPHIRSKVLAKALGKDDPLTTRVIGDAARAVGVAAANMVTMLSLDCIVIGGGLTEALDERWVKWIGEHFEDAVFPDLCRKCRVVESKLGDDAGLLGAAMLARDRLQ